MALKPGEKQPAVMTAGKFAEQYPGIYAEVVSQTIAEANNDVTAKIESAKKEGHSKGFAEGTVKGATAENERIIAVESKSLPGYEHIVKARKADGKSTGADTAEAILEAQQARLAKGLEAIQKEAPAPAENEHDGGEQPAGEEADPLKAAWESGPLSAKLKKEFGGDWESYKAYYENQDDHYKETKQVTL